MKQSILMVSIENEPNGAPLLALTKAVFSSRKFLGFSTVALSLLFGN